MILTQIIEEDHVMANKKGNKRTPMAIQAELMELYYTGDPISEHQLARQFNLARSGVHEILQKYKPKQTDRDVIMVIMPTKGYEKESPEE